MVTSLASAACSVCLITFLLAVALGDLASHRIPNALTIPAALVGVTLNCWKGGAYGGLLATLGAIVGLAAFLPMYLARGLGAGDVKAMAATGAFLGPQGALLAAACVLVVGAVGASIVLLLQGHYLALRAMTTRWMWRVTCWAGSMQMEPPKAPHPSDPTLRRFPYGVAIAAGTVAAMVWMHA